MISPHCDKCRAPLTEFGALAFSPPNAQGEVMKYHLCVQCFEGLKAWLDQRPQEEHRR